MKGRPKSRAFDLVIVAVVAAGVLIVSLLIRSKRGEENVVDADASVLSQSPQRSLDRQSERGLSNPQGAIRRSGSEDIQARGWDESMYYLVMISNMRRSSTGSKPQLLAQDGMFTTGAMRLAGLDDQEARVAQMIARERIARYKEELVSRIRIDETTSAEESTDDQRVQVLRIDHSPEVAEVFFAEMQAALSEGIGSGKARALMELGSPDDHSFMHMGLSAYDIAIRVVSGMYDEGEGFVSMRHRATIQFHDPDSGQVISHGSLWERKLGRQSGRAVFYEDVIDFSALVETASAD